MTQHPNLSIFRKEVLTLSAYKVADANNLIKLDAMENPYSWPQDIIEKWLLNLKTCPVNRYPDPEAKKLTHTLQKINNIPDQSALILGNGSDEIIQILLMALPNDAHILAPEPGFVMYKQISQSLGLNYHGVGLDPDDFSLDLNTMLTAIERFQPAIIFLAYPNNPTGNLFSEPDINKILDAAPGWVVVDEAYAPFADASYISQLPKYPSLMVMRTVSKLGLAGLRLGFLAGNPELTQHLNKIRLPYNINCLTQITADFALNNIAFLEKQTHTIRHQRQWIWNQLNLLEGIKAYPSSANFIMFKTIHKPADMVFESLKQQGVLIKNLSPQGGLLSNCLRVTIGTEEENKVFVQALSQSLA